jgi:hypothetical protein
MGEMRAMVSRRGKCGEQWPLLPALSGYGMGGPIKSAHDG